MLPPFASVLGPLDAHLRISIVATMQTKIQQWGNSLAIRIPRAYAAHARVRKGAKVEIVAQDGRLMITPVTPSAPRLDALLKKISPENLHASVETGPVAGRETWA